jgi:hypothetical protein
VPGRSEAVGRGDRLDHCDRPPLRRDWRKFSVAKAAQLTRSLSQASVKWRYRSVASPQTDRDHRQRLREIRRAGRATVLIIDAANMAALGAEAEHSFHKHRSAGAGQAGGAHDDVARSGGADRQLSTSLDAP